MHNKLQSNILEILEEVSQTELDKCILLRNVIQHHDLTLYHGGVVVDLLKDFSMTTSKKYLIFEYLKHGSADIWAEKDFDTSDALTNFRNSIICQTANSHSACLNTILSECFDVLALTPKFTNKSIKNYFYLFKHLLRYVLNEKKMWKTFEAPLRSLFQKHCGEITKELINQTLKDLNFVDKVERIERIKYTPNNNHCIIEIGIMRKIFTNVNTKSETNSKEEIF